MTQDQAFTDAELTAFLDGEAPEDLNRRLAAAMSPALEQRLQALDSGKAVALAGFDALAQAAPATPGFDLPMQQAGLAWGQIGMGLAAGLLLAVGLSQVGSLRGPDIEPWHREVAAYHALYVTETLASAPVDTAAQVAKLAALSDLVTGDLTAAATSEDMQFRRAQQLGFDGAPLIQIAYLAPGDVPVALCVLEAEGAPQDLRLSTIQGMSAASWSDGQRRFLLIGGTDDAATARRAADFAERLTRG